ncbi:TPA: transposase zinc-binding domain-containing protein [Providencia rettgeri]
MQQLYVENILACSTYIMGVLHCCCSSPKCTHSLFVYQTCKSKAYSAYDLKGSKQWFAQQHHILPDYEWEYIPLSIPTCFNLSSTIALPLCNAYYTKTCTTPVHSHPTVTATAHSVVNFHQTGRKDGIV